MNVTLRDVAKAAGVSPSTVSRVLRNSPKVHPESRERVYEAARRLGYRHNPLVDAWATRFRETHRQSGMLLAHVVGYTEEEMLRDRVLCAVSRAIQQRASELGIVLSTFTLKEGEDLSAARLKSILFHRGIKAILWGPFPSASVEVDLTEWDFSMVGVGLSEATRHLHRSVHNRYLSMHRLCHQLRMFRRPGLIGFDSNAAASHGWIQAYSLHLGTLPVRNRIPWRPLPAFDRVALSNWFERHKPDVVISPMLECCDYVEAKGCPFVGLNLSEDGDLGTVRGVTHPSSAIGFGAVDLLLAQCDWNEGGVPTYPRQVAWDGMLIGFGKPEANFS